MLALYFRIDVTFEMRTSEYIEICISIDIKIVGERVFMWNGKKGKEGKVTERQKESERVCVCVCVCWSKPMIASISIHSSVGRETQMWW